MADVTIEVKADATQAAGELKKVSGDLKKSSADPNAAIPNKQSAPAVGKAIGSAVVGYIANQGLDTLATVVGNAQGGQRTGRRIASIGGSAVAGATLGAMAGSAIPGIGTAIGGAVGAIAGAVTGFVQTMSEEAKNFREAVHNLSSAHISGAHAQTFGEQDRAFGRVISTKQRAEQVKAIEDRLTQVRFGDGENSIRNLQKRILKAEKSGETDNIDYIRDKDLFARQKAREATLERQLEDLRVPVAAPMMRATEVGDALSAMGGSVGVSVNVADINQRQLTTLERIYEVLARRAGEDPTASIAWKDHTYYQ